MFGMCEICAMSYDFAVVFRRMFVVHIVNWAQVQLIGYSESNSLSQCSLVVIIISVGLCTMDTCNLECVLSGEKGIMNRGSKLCWEGEGSNTIRDFIFYMIMVHIVIWDSWLVIANRIRYLYVHWLLLWSVSVFVLWIHMNFLVVKDTVMLMWLGRAASTSCTGVEYYNSFWFLPGSEFYIYD